MTQTGSQGLIRELARDLRPVRPIPRIRTVMAGVIVLWLAVAAAGTALLGLRPDLVEATVAAPGAILVGLGLMGLGGVTGALAMSVPGREPLVRGAVGMLIAGAVVAVGLGALLLELGPPPQTPSSFLGDLSCLTVAMLVGLLPALGVVWFAARSAPLRPVFLGLAAAAGAAALGALAAHASCTHCDMRHLLVAHALAPAFGVLLLTLPLLAALRRLRRR